MSLAYLHYDVFTGRPFAGNQLAVFLDGRGLTDGQMQAIAREMNFSESTFVLPSERPDTDVRMRIFTPGMELPMAGHPTVGTTFALAETGFLAPGRARLTFGLGVGPTPVDLDWSGSRLRFAWMTQRTPTFFPPVANRAEAAAAIGLTEDDLVPDLPVRQVSCGVPFLLVPLRDRAAVDRATPQADRLVQLTLRGQGEHAVFLFACPEAGAAADAAAGTGAAAGAGDETAYSRMFGAGLGITEDPATGSASGPLGCYLVEHGLVTPAAAGRILSLQGVAMGRPSRIHIAIEGRPGAITSVKIGGEAVLVARGELVV